MVEDVVLETLPLAAAVSTALIATEAYAYHEQWIRSRPADYGADVRERLRVGAFLSGADYVNGQRARWLVRNDVDAALARRDVLLAPTTPFAAPPVAAQHVEIGGARQPVRASLVGFNRPFNVSGHPAMSVPAGFTPDGMPVGLQIIGRPFDEATVLRVADAYQRVTDWHTRRPPLGG